MCYNLNNEKSSNNGHFGASVAVWFGRYVFNDE